MDKGVAIVSDLMCLSPVRGDGGPSLIFSIEYLKAKAEQNGISWDEVILEQQRKLAKRITEDLRAEGLERENYG